MKIKEKVRKPTYENCRTSEDRTLELVKNKIAIKNRTISITCENHNNNVNHGESIWEGRESKKRKWKCKQKPKREWTTEIKVQA